MAENQNKKQNSKAKSPRVPRGLFASKTTLPPPLLNKPPTLNLTSTNNTTLFPTPNTFLFPTIFTNNLLPLNLLPLTPSPNRIKPNPTSPTSPSQNNTTTILLFFNLFTINHTKKLNIKTKSTQIKKINQKIIKFDNKQKKHQK